MKNAIGRVPIRRIQDNYYGAGILKSIDGGQTWTDAPSPFAGATAFLSPYCGGATIGSLAVDPSNSQVLLAGVFFGCAPASKSGIYRSADGGTTWTPVLVGAVGTAVMFDPSGNNAYAALGTPWGGTSNGVWQSTDGGETWMPDNGSGTTTLPASSAGRIALAIAPSSPTTLYAGVASASSNSVSLLGVFKTTDGGTTWTQLTTAPNYCSPQGVSTQCYFDNVVAVAPNDANVVLLGGSTAGTGYAGTLFLSMDGGSSWKDITQDANGVAIHPDMHALAFSIDGKKMYAGNDGGVWSTTLDTSGAGLWVNLNSPLALTQFYPGLSMDPTTPSTAFAGSQDNGTQHYSGQLAWQAFACGDGAQTAFDYSSLNTLYVGCDYVPPNLSPSGKPRAFLGKLTANPPTAALAQNGINGSDRGWFIPPLEMDPSNPHALYFGTYRVYQTTDSAGTWTPISNDLTANRSGLGFLAAVTAITVAPSDSNTVYAGSGDGLVWVTTNASAGTAAVWTKITFGLPNRSVTRIAVVPANAQTTYVAFSGFSGFTDQEGHVFATTNGGASWTDISGNLPNIPVNDLVVDSDIPNTLYAATDIGVFETTDGGTSWSPLGSGLPKVAVFSLVLHHAMRILRAASYGRSAWDIQLPAPPGATAVLSTPTLFFAEQEVGTTSAAQSVILTNNGSAALNISSIAPSGDFAVASGTTCSTSTPLAAGANCTMNVSFAPTTFGTRTGTVTIADNAASGTSQTIKLKGNAFSGAVSLSPTSLAFGNQLVGTTSAAQTVTLANTASSPLTILATTAGPDFAYTTDCPVASSSLVGGTSCHITISFSPRSMGQLTEQITLTDSALDSPQGITVTGNGLAPVATFSPGGLTFNWQEVGTTSPPQVPT